MVKKFKTLEKSDDSQLTEAIRTSAQQIWQAGLGAFAKAQEEGGKVFAKLVKEGSELQKRTQHLAEEKVSDVSKIADKVSTQATGSWDKLEHIFEDRVSRSLNRLGVPNKKDIDALTKRVEELSKAVAELSSKKTSVVKAATKVASRKTATAALAPTDKPAPKSRAKKVAAPVMEVKKSITKPRT